MSTHRMSILGALTPAASGAAFFEPSSVKGTNDPFPTAQVLIYTDTATRDGVYGAFPVPKNYVGTAAIIIVWTSTATSGDVEWDVDYRAVGGNDTESLDQTGTQESVNINDTAPSAAHERMEISLGLTSANLTVDDTVQMGIFRDGTDAGDTMAAAAIVWDILFEYADA
jgi:hypothetical protein